MHTSWPRGVLHRPVAPVPANGVAALPVGGGRLGGIHVAYPFADFSMQVPVTAREYCPAVQDPREGNLMRKIRMSLEELQVESFATTNGDGAGRGTVLGQQSGLNCAGYSDGDEECHVDPSYSV